TPEALRGREQGIAAVAFLIVSVVLIAVDDDLVANLPALHLAADRPYGAGRVEAGYVIGILMSVDRRHRRAESRPHAVVIDAGRHHENEDFVVGNFPRWQHFDLERAFRRPVTLLADCPR